MHPTWLAPLLQSDAEIFEESVIGVESASVRRKYTDVLRREVQNLPKFCFLFANSFFGNFALFDFSRKALPLRKVKLCLFPVCNVEVDADPVQESSIACPDG